MKTSLKWIAYSEVEAEALAEMGYVVVASLAGVVGNVEGYAYIAPEE